MPRKKNVPKSQSSLIGIEPPSMKGAKKISPHPCFATLSPKRRGETRLKILKSPSSSRPKYGSMSSVSAR